MTCVCLGATNRARRHAVKAAASVALWTGSDCSLDRNADVSAPPIRCLTLGRARSGGPLATSNMRAFSATSVECVLPLRPLALPDLPMIGRLRLAALVPVLAADASDALD